MGQENQLSTDDCASWGKDQSWAVVWFVSVLVIAPVFVSFLASIDSWMYYNKDQVDVSGVALFDSEVKLLDDEKYAENRRASFGIASESLDPRSNAQYSTISR